MILFTSRTIQLTPSQPEGFQLTELKIKSDKFPDGFKISNGTLSGDTWTISIDNPDTEEIDGFVIDSSGLINITFTFDYDDVLNKIGQDIVNAGNFVFNIAGKSEFSMDNVVAERKSTIEPPIIKEIKYDEDYAFQIKEIENETLNSEYTLTFRITIQLQELYIQKDL